MSAPAAGCDPNTAIAAAANHPAPPGSRPSVGCGQCTTPGGPARSWTWRPVWWLRWKSQTVPGHPCTVAPSNSPASQGSWGLTLWSCCSADLTHLSMVQLHPMGSSAIGFIKVWHKHFPPQKDAQTESLDTVWPLGRFDYSQYPCPLSTRSNSLGTWSPEGSEWIKMWRQSFHGHWPLDQLAIDVLLDDHPEKWQVEPQPANRFGVPKQKTKKLRFQSRISWIRWKTLGQLLPSGGAAADRPALGESPHLPHEPGRSKCNKVGFEQNSSKFGIEVSYKITCVQTNQSFTRSRFVLTLHVSCSAWKQQREWTNQILLIPLMGAKTSK